MSRTSARQSTGPAEKRAVQNTKRSGPRFVSWPIRSRSKTSKLLSFPDELSPVAATADVTLFRAFLVNGLAFHGLAALYIKQCDGERAGRVERPGLCSFNVNACLVGRGHDET